MTVVPLVLALVVVGVNTATDAAASGRIARRAIVVFIVILTGGAVFAALAAPLVFALFPHNPALIAALDHASVPAVAQTAPVNWIDTLLAIVPSNAIMAAAPRPMVPPGVFALVLG